MKGLTVAVPLTVTQDDGHYNLIKDYMVSVKQNIRMLIYTSPGERIMIPQFGVGIKKYLFEVDTPELREAIKQQVTNQIVRFMPYLSNVSVSVGNYLNESQLNTFSLEISYNIQSFAGYRDFLTVFVR